MWVLFLLTAWAAAVASCAWVCHASVTADRRQRSAPAPSVGPAGDRGLHVTAFLSGGPHRVADLTLVLLSRQRRLHLARTGWATVLDAPARPPAPRGPDALELALLDAVGPDGQAPVPRIRAAFAAQEAVRSLELRLVAAGLAVPGAARRAVRDAIRAVRASAVLAVAMFVLAAALRPGGADPALAGWFAIPLLMSLGCLAVARAELGPGVRWASALGADRLRGEPIPAPRAADADELAALAAHGPAALRDPELREALTAGGRPYADRV
ncbi:TIGR04222 domain-containing membrane protein [Streptomyces capparidis]